MVIVTRDRTPLKLFPCLHFIVSDFLSRFELVEETQYTPFVSRLPSPKPLVHRHQRPVSKSEEVVLGDFIPVAFSRDVGFPGIHTHSI